MCRALLVLRWFDVCKKITLKWLYYKYHCEGRTPETKSYIVMSKNPVDIEIGGEEHNWAKYHCEGRTSETKG